MRQAGARAAALLLALALFATGCDLIGSLTPFGIGHQDQGTGGDNVNGLWAGTTTTGGAVTFQVGSDTVLRPIFHHIANGCDLTFENSSALEPVVDGVFTVEVDLSQGRFVAAGTFTSSTTCSGTYSFEALPAGVCPSTGSGSFAAVKTTR